MNNQKLRKFIKSGKYCINIYLDKNDFISLSNYLEKVGLDQQYIKLPLNEKSSERGGKDPVKMLEFLKTDRNYKSLILLASNETSEVRILFRNSNIDVTFYDDIFPSAGSNTIYNYYIASDEVCLTYSIHLFLQDFFEKYRTKNSNLVFRFIFLIIAITGFPYLVWKLINQHVLLGFIPIVITFILSFAYSHFSPLTGVYFHNPENAKPLSESIAQLKSQWIILVVSALLGLIGTLIGGYISHLSGWNN